MLSLAAAGVSHAPSATSATTHTSTTDLFCTFALPSSNDARCGPSPAHGKPPDSMAYGRGRAAVRPRSAERREGLARTRYVVGRGPRRHVEQQALDPRIEEHGRPLGDLGRVAPGEPHGKHLVVDVLLGLPRTTPAVRLLVGVGDDHRAETRADDVPAVSALGLAMSRQHVELVADRLDVAEAVPHVGVAGGQTQRLALAAAAD